jgi:hypothetical protein
MKSAVTDGFNDMLSEIQIQTAELRKESAGAGVLFAVAPPALPLEVKRRANRAADVE